MKDKAEWVTTDAMFVVSEMDIEDLQSCVEENSSWEVDSPAHLRYIDRLCWVWENQLKVLRYLRRQKMLDLTNQGYSQAEAGRFIALGRTRSHELVDQAMTERIHKHNPFTP